MNKDNVIEELHCQLSDVRETLDDLVAILEDSQGVAAEAQAAAVDGEYKKALAKLERELAWLDKEGKARFDSYIQAVRAKLVDASNNAHDLAAGE